MSSSVSTTISPVPSSKALAMSAYGTSSPPMEQTRLNETRPPSVAWTWRNEIEWSSRAVYSFTGHTTRPNSILPFHIERVTARDAGGGFVAGAFRGGIEFLLCGGGVD